MPKIIMGVAMVGFAIATIASGGVIGAVGVAIISSLLSLGGGLLVAGIAGMLQHNPGVGISVRQSAAPWQVVYGQARVGGVIAYLYLSNDNTYLQMVVILACHQIESMDALYLDGKKVYAELQSDGQTWQATGGDHYDFANNKYNFDGLVFYQLRLGAPGQTAFASLIGIGDDTFTDASTFSGRACIQLSLHYSTSQFPSGIPGIKCDIRGKCDILDPRTGATGYTTNPALCIADMICNTDFGFQADMATEIDQAQLIADANLCDEEVSTSQGDEPRYTCNGSFSTDSTPGDALQQMLTCNAGRVTYIGGLWKIFSGSYTGYTILLDENDLAGKLTWNATRKYREQINAIKGTFISPCYPYTSAGPGLYDNEPQPGIFDGQWQSTDFPPYAQDVLHGYPSDANYTADNNTRLWKDVTYRFTISAATAQRLAKIELLRSRLNDGNATFKMTAYRLQALDNFGQTFAPLGWGGKVFEIQTFTFAASAGKGEDSPPVLSCEVKFRENSPDVYAWASTEEVAMDSNGLVRPDTSNPAQPTDFTLDSSSATSTVNQSGIRTPRILATWTAAADGLVAQYQLQIQENTGTGAGPWMSCGLVSSDETQCYISGVTVGASYNVRILSQYNNGAVSEWLTVGPEIVSDTYDSVTSSVIFNNLGNLLPTLSVPFSVTNAVASGLINSTLSSAAYTAYPLPSGSTVNLPAYSVTFTGLAVTSSYAAVPRFCIATGVIDCPDGAVENGPSADQLAQANLDGYLWLNTVGWTTPNGTGTGGGINGGGACPHEDEPVQVWNGNGQSTARAGDVQCGDWLRGLDIASGRPVWRKVRNVGRVRGSVWSAVPDGEDVRLLTPFEKLLWEGKWVEASAVPGAKQTEKEGHRVDITLEAVRYDDQNYYVGGLLAHNQRISKGG